MRRTLCKSGAQPAGAAEQQLAYREGRARFPLAEILLGSCQPALTHTSSLIDLCGAEGLQTCGRSSSSATVTLSERARRWKAELVGENTVIGLY